jgi:predicted membrane metal-binding protein
MVRMPATTRGRLTLAALLLALVALALVAPVSALGLAPAIALFAMAAGEVMPGAERFARVLARHRPRRPRAVRSVPAYTVIVVRRTGRLLASALAMRPPPAPLLVHS